jgi:SAM-dependent methyltransferase
MAHPDEIKWNARYLSEKSGYLTRQPHALLTSYADSLPETGLVLDIACGLAASSLYLASRHWRVIGLDIAEAALRMVQNKARKTDMSVSLAVMDLTSPWLPVSHFDAILNFYYLSRPLWDIYRKSLKPGGWLFFETFLWQSGIEVDREYYLQPGELRQAFSDWEIVHYEELERPHASHAKRQIAQLVARKPGC